MKERDGPISAERVVQTNYIFFRMFWFYCLWALVSMPFATSQNLLAKIVDV